MPVTVTFDLEDNRSSSAQEARFVPMTERFLEFLAERSIAATVFVVGEIARDHPALVARVAAAGHEVGLHGLRHVPLGEVGPARLLGELRSGLALLEDAAQVPVEGFRAPIFSLTPATRWAAEIIAEAGFRYSSSVLPARNPLHGWPGAPREPCRWASGMLELPCPVGGLGPMQMPFLGGIYLRYVPERLLGRLLGDLGTRAVPWSYLHPYDLDANEPFFVPPHAGWLTSRLLHTRRTATLPRLETVLAAAGGPGRRLDEIARGLTEHDLAQLPAI